MFNTLFNKFNKKPDEKKDERLDTAKYMQQAISKKIKPKEKQYK